MANSALNACSASAMQLLLRAAEQILVADMDGEHQQQARNAAVATSASKPSAVASYITSSAKKVQLSRLDSAREKLSLQRSAIESSAMLTFITSEEERKAMEIAMNVCLTRTKNLARTLDQLLYDHSPEAMPPSTEVKQSPCMSSPFSAEACPRCEPTTPATTNSAIKKAESIDSSPANSNVLDTDSAHLRVSNSADVTVDTILPAVTPKTATPIRKLPPGQLSLSMSSTPTKPAPSVSSTSVIPDSWTVSWYEHPLSWIQWEANLHRLPIDQRGCSNPMCMTDTAHEPGSYMELDACKGCSIARFCCDACHDAALASGIGHGYTCAPLQAVFERAKPTNMPEDTLLTQIPYAPFNSLIDDSPPSK